MDKKERFDNISKTTIQTGQLVHHSKNLVLTAIALAVIIYAVFSGDGVSMINKLYSNITGANTSPFVPQQDRFNPAYLVVTSKLRREGHSPELSEFTYRKTGNKGEERYEIRWTRPDSMRTFTVNRKPDNTWLVLEPDQSNQ